MLRLFSVIIFLNIISKILGFGRELTLSYYFGATNITDAYLIGLSIPAIVFGIVGYGLVNSFIPIYNTIKLNESEKEAYKFTNNFTNIFLLFSILIFIICEICSPYIVRLFATGFDVETFEIAVYFTRIAAFSVFFLPLIAIYTAFLEANEKFILIGFQSIALNLIYILGTYISYKYNYRLLMYFSNLALFSQVLVLLWGAYKAGFSYKLKFLDLNDKYIKHIVILSIPVIIGASLEKINLLVDRTVASYYGNGAITMLSYAGTLNGAFLSLTLGICLSILFPQISRLALNKDRSLFEKKISDTKNFIIVFGIPITFSLFFLSEDIIRFIFGRGKFNEDDVILAAKIFSCYSISFLAFGLRDLYTKIFYAFKKTKIVLFNSSIGIALNITLNLILPKFFGLLGVALATSISVITVTILLAYNVSSKYGIAWNRNQLIILLKSTVVSTLMISFIYFIDQYIHINNAIILYAILGSLFYIAIAYLFKIQEIRLIIDIIRKRIMQE